VAQVVPPGLHGDVGAGLGAVGRAGHLAAHLTCTVIVIRVTSLSEFSPNGLLFNLGSVLKITKVAYIFVKLFP
jgi:hypothetical protein